jgi:DNA-directed RNA polymerase specialized sigma24 family protein
LSGIRIPVEIFSDRHAAVLESLVEYLRDTYKLSYAEIGRLMNRNERTIWTVYRRAKAK